MLRWEGLPADATVLVPSLGPTPMRVPDNAWAMLVLAVDILGEVDPDTAGQVALFAGSWLADQPHADLHDGDLVIRPLPTEQDLGMPGDNHVADVEVLLAYRGRWMPIGRWAGVDRRWPWTVAPTVAAAMRLYIDAAETLSREAVLTSERPGSSPLRWAGAVLSDLMSADLVTYGEELVWERCAGEVHHTARLRIDGTFLLADGERVSATPSAAATALSGKHHHGWSAWRRTSDGRFLADLRADLRARRDRSAPCTTRHHSESQTPCRTARPWVGGPTVFTHEGLVMAEPDVPADLQVVWGSRVEIERGYRLEAIAVALSADIAELREDGGLPDHVHTRITVMPQHRLLQIPGRGPVGRD